VTETPVGGPKIPQTCAEALWPLNIPRTPRRTLELTMADAPAPLCDALRAILPTNAQRVHVVIDWDGDPSTTIR
jgi:hypothetical protein